jgi:transcriptional regulator with XRE-family HTH domain
MNATTNHQSTIGTEIARRMVDLGVTTAELSSRSKGRVSAKQIWRITTGVTQRPHNDTLKTIADALGCRPSDLLRGEGHDGNHRGSDQEGLPG